MRKFNIFENTVKFTFLILISLPILDLFLHFMPANVNNEKRDLTHDTSKEWSIGYIKDFFNKYDSNFSGRSYLVNLYIGLKKLIPNNSPLPQKVLIGKDGYYFLVDYNGMDDYRNVSRWKKDELENLVTKLESNQAFLDSLHVPYVIVVVPEKQHIYPEYLPDHISKIEGQSRLEQFKNYLSINKSKLSVIDLADVLLKQKSKNLYFKKDSHWNYEGGYVGYKAVMNYNYERFNIPYDSNRVYITKVEAENDLDLAKVMGESFYTSEITTKYYPLDSIQTVDFDPGFEVSDYIKRRKPDYVIGKTNPKGKGKMFMFRDSYTALWSDYFTYDFNQSVFVWKYDFDRDMILKFKPDIVIQEVAQRHLEFLNK